MKYQKRIEFVEAEQFTEAVALAHLIDKKPGPFGMAVYGHYNPELRKIYSTKGSVYDQNGNRHTVLLGQWIVKDADGDISLFTPDEFAAAYEVVQDKPKPCLHPFERCWYDHENQVGGCELCGVPL